MAAGGGCCLHADGMRFGEFCVWQMKFLEALSASRDTIPTWAWSAPGTDDPLLAARSLPLDFETHIHASEVLTFSTPNYAILLHRLPLSSPAAK